MKLKSLLLCLLFPMLCAAAPEKAITFGWGGRLGDNLLDYAHAKWLSYKFGIPLYLHTFEYSDQFVFDDIEPKLTEQERATFHETILKSLDPLHHNIRKKTLFFLPHACDSYEEYVFNGSYGIYVSVNWEDHVFRNMMRALICPKKQLELISPPSGIISVALHYRTGGGFVWDTDSMKRGLPLRFPAFEYYIEQLRNLFILVGYQPLYVHIFTDDPDPENIKQQFKELFPSPDIQFACRAIGNRHDANVLEDLFSMMNFDCLIRPMSHYSMTASHLGNFKIEFYPTHGYWENGRFVVDQVKKIQKASWNCASKSWIH